MATMEFRLLPIVYDEALNSLGAVWHPYWHSYQLHFSPFRASLSEQTELVASRNVDENVWATESKYISIYAKSQIDCSGP